MLPTRTLFENWGSIWGSQALLENEDSLQPAFRPIVADFTPSLDLNLGSIVLSGDDLFDDDVRFVLEEQVEDGHDAITGDKLIRFGISATSTEPLPYFKSTPSANGTTVYGFALINLASNVLLATHKLPVPISITRTETIIDIPDFGFRLPPAMVR